MDQSWRDPTAAWWAKLERANKHITEIHSMMKAFEESEAYTVRREGSDKPNVVAFRFKIVRPVPVQLLTAIGDAVHNMRSALDSVAFELARQHLQGSLTEKQEKAVEFPIYQTRSELEDFFERRNQRGLYGEHDKEAIGCVQPFAMREEAGAHGAMPLS